MTPGGKAWGHTRLGNLKTDPGQRQLGHAPHSRPLAGSQPCALLSSWPGTPLWPCSAAWKPGPQSAVRGSSGCLPAWAEPGRGGQVNHLLEGLGSPSCAGDGDDGGRPWSPQRLPFARRPLRAKASLSSDLPSQHRVPGASLWA